MACLPAETKLRSSKYLNNLIEQDHRGVKQKIATMLGFKGFATAAITIAGIELMHRIRKGQFGLGRLGVVDLRLQCGMPCSKLEVSTVQHGTLSAAGYLRQSPPEGIVTAFKACRAFNGRLANADNKITHRALRLRRRPRARDRPSGRRFSDRPRRDARLNGVSGDAFANRPRSSARMVHHWGHPRPRPARYERRARNSSGASPRASTDYVFSALKRNPWRHCERS